MIELRPVGVTQEIRAQSRILLPNHWVKFLNFPDYLSHVKDKTMRVVKQMQVTYSLSYILKEACYKDVNLSNEDTGVKLYPDAGEELYEVLIGIKPWNGYIIPFFPAEQPLARLGYPTMTPLVSDAALKYLGTISPQDSPPENPSFRLYLMYNLKPAILRLVCDDGVSWDKCTLEFLVNRCVMESGMPPENITPKPIYYLDALKF